MFSNWQYRIFALFLAIACWYFVSGREAVETWIEVPVVTSNAPQDIVVLSGLRSKVNVRVRGSQALMRGMDAARLTYDLDLSSLEVGESLVAFEAANIRLSKALEAVEFDPPRMTLKVDRIAQREAAVVPVWKEGPGKDYSLVRGIVIPETVRLKGPESILSSLNSVKTLEVSAGTEPFAGVRNIKASLDLPEGVESSPEDVTLQLEFAVKTKTVWVKLPVKVLPENGSKATIRPSTVQIQVETPVTLLHEENFKDGFSAYVLLTSALESGKHIMAYRIKLPPGVELLKTVPEKVEIRLKKK